MRITILLGAALLCPLAFRAADNQIFDVKPGLWESSVTTQMSGMPPIPQETQDRMTEAQRKNLKAAMSRMGNRTTTAQHCVTKEDIAKSIASANRQNETCTSNVVNSSSSKVDVHLECSQVKNDIKATGDISIERVDSEHVKGAGTLKAAGANGRNMDIKWSMTSKFLSADCGDVKPGGK